MTLHELLPVPSVLGSFFDVVCVCVSKVGVFSLLWLQSLYRLQVMPGPDKRSPIPMRAVWTSLAQPEELD